MQARRLKTREQFQALLATFPIARSAHFAMHRMFPDTTGEQPEPAAGQPVAGICFGAMVPKRWARRAVTRNLVKRQIFNLAEKYAEVLPPASYLVRLRTGFDRTKFVSAASQPLRAAVRLELEHLLRKVANTPPEVRA